MITWIQVILQKHHKVVFTILLGVIIVAFVFTIGSSIPFLGDRQARRVETKDVFGYNFEDPATMQMLSRQAEIELFLRGAGGRISQDMIKYAVARYAYLSSLAEKSGVLGVNQADLVDYIQSLPAFQDENGAFNPESWNTIVSMIGMPEKEFEKIVAANAIANKMEKLIMGPGYTTASEVDLAYTDSYGKWNVTIANMPLESFKPEIAPDEAKLKEYFNANAEMFRVPASAALDVMFFSAEGLASKSDFSDDEIKKFYDKNSLRYGEMKNGEYKTKELAEVKSQVVLDMKKAEGAQAALVAADDLATRIYDAETTYGSEEFKKIIAEAKAEIKQLPHLLPTDTNLPEGVPAKVVKAGFNLGPQNFYSDPIPTENGAWIVFFRESKPSFIPQFSEIKDKVETAYKNSEKARLFSEMGVKAVEEIKAGLKDGKKFSDLAKAAGFTVSTIDGFSFSESAFHNPSMYTNLQLLSDQLPKMRAGDVSPMITRPTGGYIIYASAFEAPKAKPDDKEYKRISDAVADQSREFSARSIIGPELQKAISAESR